MWCVWCFCCWSSRFHLLMWQRHLLHAVKTNFQRTFQIQINLTLATRSWQHWICFVFVNFPSIARAVVFPPLFSLTVAADGGIWDWKLLHLREQRQESLVGSLDIGIPSEMRWVFHFFFVISWSICINMIWERKFSLHHQAGICRVSATSNASASHMAS